MKCQSNKAQRLKSLKEDRYLLICTFCTSQNWESVFNTTGGPQGGLLAKIPHWAQRNNHVLEVSLELSALQSDI
mgnify:CR=1 FL=1